MVESIMTASQKISALQLASEKYERREYASAIELLEPLAKLGDVKAKSYLTEIYWRVQDHKCLKRAAQLQEELNSLYKPSTSAYQLGIFREALMLLEEADDSRNKRLNSLFVDLKNSQYDRNLLLAASMAKSNRIAEENRCSPLFLYMKAFARASRVKQKIWILGLITLEVLNPSKKPTTVFPRTIK